MAQHPRLNNSHACIACTRRSQGLAVGTPQKLGWYCLDCSPDTARKALYMQNREFDTLERLAAEKVAEQAGEGAITIQAAELPAFIAWAVKSFADTMRDHLENGNAPF